MTVMIYLSTVRDASDVDSATKLSEWRIDINIEQLCGSLLNLLHGAVSQPMKASRPHRTGLVEKCCIIYNTLLNIKFAGMCQCITVIQLHEGTTADMYN